MLRGIAGIRIADSMGSTVAESTRGYKIGRELKPVECVLRITVDGIVLPPLSNIDAVIPKDVYGVGCFSDRLGPLCSSAASALTPGAD